MSVLGAVLEQMEAPRPYAQSRPLRVSTIQLEQPGAGEVMVRLEAASICHSDLSVVDGTRRRQTPLLLGHEAAGIITMLGEDVSGLAIGDRVVLTFLPRCGSCEACATNGRIPCEVGSAANGRGVLLGDHIRLTRDGEQVFHHLGVSAFASHAVVNQNSIVRIDQDVPADVAALLGCAVLTGGGAVLNSLQPTTGDTVIVVGLGGVGMAALITALALEGVTVVGVDTSPDKLEFARQLGASATYTTGEARAAGIRGTHVLEAAGRAAAFDVAFELTAPGGITATVGLPGPSDLSTLSPLTLTAEARTVVGSYLGSAVPQRDIPKFVELWRAGRLPVEALISGRIELEEINEAMDALADGLALRQIITFPGQEEAS
ncbi:alcohol dehydrogenase catalytic domain-containing protein [Microbacterium sp. NPDC077644]|uniref:alcohol dehydrogenase catalytic domain-containing protein n=1 Tax=Microbacterium sp. NPDC077644 TaxID=3155055 RepID=UPI00344E46B2